MDIKNVIVEETILIEKILRGETSLFGVLVERYKNLVYSLILRMVRDKDAADDLAQEVFFRVYKNLSKYKPEYNFRNWIYTITLNLVRNHLRRKKIRTFLSFSLLSADDKKAVDKELSDNSLPLTGEKEGKDNELINKSLKLLSGKNREIFILHYIKEIPCKDIAEIMKLSETNVKVILHRARRMIYEKLRDGIN